MSMNDPGTNPQWPQQPPPKTGMKGSTKVLIGLAIAFGVLCVLCCGIIRWCCVLLQKRGQPGSAKGPASNRIHGPDGYSG